MLIVFRLEAYRVSVWCNVAYVNIFLGLRIGYVAYFFYR